MAVTTIEGRLTGLWESARSLYGWLSTVDHNTVGICSLLTNTVPMVGAFMLGIGILISTSSLSYTLPHALLAGKIPGTPTGWRGETTSPPAIYLMAAMGLFLTLTLRAAPFGCRFRR